MSKFLLCQNGGIFWKWPPSPFWKCSKNSSSPYTLAGQTPPLVTFLSLLSSPIPRDSPSNVLGNDKKRMRNKSCISGGKNKLYDMRRMVRCLINLVATVCVCDWDSPRCKQMGTTVLWGTCGTKFNTSSFLWNIDIVPMAEVETWPSPSRGSVEQAKDMGAAASSSETGTLIGSAGLQDI